MSAVIVVLAAVGVFVGLAVASKRSGDERSRTIAAALAQQDQERLRAMSPTALASLVTAPLSSRTSTATQSGTTFTTTSTAAWVDDHATTTACAGDVSSARYLKITSSVTWPKATRTVNVDSLISAPSGGGTLAAQIWDGSKNPLSGITVTLTGPRSASATTGSGGCVQWDYLPAGTYTVSLNQQGYVTPQGQQSTSQSAVVADGATNTLTFEYAQSGTLGVAFWSQEKTLSGTTYTYNAAAGASQVDDRVTVKGGELLAPRVFPPTGGFVSSIETKGDQTPPSTGLFPSTAAYTVWGGDCGDEDPSNYAAVKNDPNAQPSAVVKPGVFNAAVAVRLPMVDLTIQEKTATGTGAPADGLPVLFTRANGPLGCPATTITRKTAPDKVRGVAHGAIDFPALPFGSWTACFSDLDASKAAHKVTYPFTLNSWAVPAQTLTLDLTSAANLGTCP